LAIPSKTYFVKKIDPGGRDSSGAHEIPWDAAIVLDDFAYPWEDEISPRMKFCALHDERWLYCFFEVQDPRVKIHISQNVKHEVLHSDRVEIFFSTDESLTHYYGLEIDPQGRVYDYKASFYRKFDDAWQWPADHYSIRTDFSETGYKAWLSVSFDSLKKFDLIKSGKIITGIFRGKCTEIDLQTPRIRWISWVRPDSPFPDFHIPSAFGMLALEE
jgi:hypothetical protein